jgi:hypothetical protein
MNVAIFAAGLAIATKCWLAAWFRSTNREPTLKPRLLTCRSKRAAPDADL